jgi:hypothetical protein
MNHLNTINEQEWNFHFGKEHNGQPYISDNKYQMAGRSTGHFGSGTYFSTYRDINDIDKYGELSRNQNPNFIEIKDHVYRVDFDLYKNLYRVRNKRQGDVLYTMMANLNHMFYRITDLGEFRSKSANYNNAGLYQEIKANADALNLKCPSYYQLVRMAQNHKGIQSFSTLFMELNGYNGVNVSGVEYYDNTLHGSVIYDLSKVNGDMEEVNPRTLYTDEPNPSNNDTVVYNSLNDYNIAALRGKDLFWPSELNGMPTNEALRLLKNHIDGGHILDPFTLKNINDNLLKRYFRLLFTRNNTDFWGDKLCDEILNGRYRKYYIELIEKTNSLYWANYNSKKASGLIALLDSFERNLDWGLNNKQELRLKKQYLKKLQQYITRPLTQEEQDYIKDDYLYDTTQNESTNKHMKKQVIRLTESDLHDIVKESVHNVLKERKRGTN